jgi:manganese transport protein
LFGMPNIAVAPRRTRPERGLWRLFGPAFVAAVAYVDPGNVAANLTAGASYGYLLLWVLVAANAMAVVIQYLSAKLGLVTGSTLPQLIGKRLGRRSRLAFWGQAEIVAAATDIAEVIGGALALNLLFGIPLVWGGLIVGVVSMALLSIHSRRGQRTFEFVIIGLLAIIAIGFTAGLFVAPVDWNEAAGGLIPRFGGPETVLLAASMLGATVMPHAIYLHSALARDRHRALPGSRATPRLLRATRLDVTWSMLAAGGVNIGMLLLAAASLPGVSGTESIEGAHAALADTLGPTIATVFAIGLLASGLAASSVGAHAGAIIMDGLLMRRIPLLARRAVTLVPALVILAAGADPTWALVLSQVVLSLGIPFALVPLVRLTAQRSLLGDYANRRSTTVVAIGIAALIIALNATLIVITIAG